MRLGRATFARTRPARGRCSSSRAGRQPAPRRPSSPRGGAGGGAVAGVRGPEAAIQRQGDFTVATGAARGTIQGQAGTVAFVTLVGRGRAQSVLGIATSDELMKQVAAFFESLNVGGGGG